MKLSQIVITRTVLGSYKLTLMSAQQTEEVFRGNAMYVLWKIARHFWRLREHKAK